MRRQRWSDHFVDSVSRERSSRSNFSARIGLKGCVYGKTGGRCKPGYDLEFECMGFEGTTQSGVEGRVVSRQAR
jgi:hypothetical protein